MSSILRALKKLENDPRHKDETRPLETKFVPLADTGPQKTAGVFMLIIGGGIVCGLVILAGLWLFSEKKQPAPVVEHKISQPDKHQLETASVIPEASGPAAPPADSRETDQSSEDLAALSKTKGPAARSKPLKLPQHSPEAIGQKEPLPVAGQAAAVPPQLPAAESHETTAQVPVEKVAAASSAPDISAAAKELEIPLLNDPEILLQAITWSANPQKRIAVINNRIVRQGEVVAGYKIYSINQDDIVLSDGDEKWKLLFRIR